MSKKQQGYSLLHKNSIPDWEPTFSSFFPTNYPSLWWHNIVEKWHQMMGEDGAKKRKRPTQLLHFVLSRLIFIYTGAQRVRINQGEWSMFPTWLLHFQGLSCQAFWEGSVESTLLQLVLSILILRLQQNIEVWKKKT